VANNSILLHSGLNPAWHFWLSTRFFFLKMKSIEKILQIFRSLENFFEIVQKNTQTCLKLISFVSNKRLSVNQNVRHDHATMQQDVLLHFWAMLLYWNQAEIWSDYSVVQLSSFFIVYLYTSLLWTTVRLPGKSYKMQQKEWLLRPNIR
jgi:hypothetical protein